MGARPSQGNIYRKCSSSRNIRFLCRNTKMGIFFTTLDQGLQLWDLLFNVGEQYQLIAAGDRALEKSSDRIPFIQKR
ncbi:hypothetical protein GCM10020331_002820 [Ectobacillus funiculus]